MADNIGQHEISDLEGATSQFSGSVSTTSTAIPASSGEVISEALVRCSSDQPNSRRLEVSFDGGATFMILAPGEFVGWGLKGSVTQIYIKASSSTTEYDIVLNREL